jgi:hypothetical protein
MGEVVGELARAGLTSDSHGATPAHRLFARTNEQWRAAGRQWLADPAENKGAVLISLLVDGRPIHGDPGPTSVARVFQELRTSPSALRILLQQSLLQRARLRSVRTLLSRRQEPFNVKEHALVASTMPGPRTEVENKAMIKSTTPISSAVTPTAFTTAITRTATELITVVMISSSRPSTMALVAPLRLAIEGSPPTIWKPDQMAGRTACMAIAAAATVTICAMIMVQPANQPTTWPPSRRAHW